MASKKVSAALPSQASAPVPSPAQPVETLGATWAAVTVPAAPADAHGLHGRAEPAPVVASPDPGAASTSTVPADGEAR